MTIKDEKYIDGSRFNERIHRLISALLVSFMMASAGLTVAQSGHQIAPNWNGGYLAAIGFFIALERFYSHRFLRKQSSFSREWIVFVSTQWVVNIVVIKLVVALSAGLDTLIAEIPRWQRSFGEAFFSPEFLVAIIFAILVWMIVGYITELLDEMGLDSAMIAREVLASFTQGQEPPRQRLMAIIFAIGGGLLFFTALARVDTRALFANESGVFRQLSPLEGGGSGTLLYFMFGLALLSQAQYITLNTRWFLAGVPVKRSIAANWAIYSVSLLIFIAMVASILPTNYSFGILSVLGYLLQIIMGIIVLIFSIILAIVGFILSIPFLLFGLDTPANMPNLAMPLPTETPPPPVVSASTPFPWLDLLKSVLFWGVFLLIIGYSIAQYLRQHEEILDGVRKIPGWKILSAFWHWVMGMFGGFNRRVAGVFERARTRLQPQRDSGVIGSFRRFASLRRLSSRQKVLFYYHALVRRGDETGMARKGSESPDEYAGKLEQSMPTVEDEINSLTDAFSKARYSRDVIEADDVTQVKTYWEQIRRVFRGRRG